MEWRLKSATQQGRAIAFQSCFNARADCANGSNRCDTQCKTGKEHAKAAQTAAQFTHGKTGRYP